MTIQAYLGDSWKTLTTTIDYQSEPVLTTRIDDAFASGTVKCFYTMSEPIPPYTPFIIDGKFYVGSSNVTKYRSEANLYIHDIELLEAAAILECFIIGVKVYSAESPTWSNDSVKFASLLSQAERLYPDWRFKGGNANTNETTYLSTNITTSKTYLFDATSTLYSCLNQICLENNKKLVVSFDEELPSKIYIELVDVPSATTYSITTTNILNEQKNQERVDYGRYLETYASNVVDRDTITLCTWIAPKAEDVALNDDTCKIFLPAGIESIVQFGVHQMYQIDVVISGISNYFDNPSSTFDHEISYLELSMITCNIDGDQVRIFDYVYNYYLRDYFPNCSKTEFYNNVRVGSYIPNGDYIVILIPGSLNGMFPMDAVEEKAVWDLRTPQDQAGTLVYSIGSNTIENLNGKYKNDLWNQIIGQSRGNFLTNHSTYIDETRPYPLNQFTFQMSQLGSNTSPTGNYFWIKYHPITNPFLRDTKESMITPHEVKEFGRSYGNSANFIDFNKIIPNMHISNETLGKVEAVIELDVTNDTPPVAGQQTTYNSSTWYISSVIMRHKVEARFATVTLVKNYNKKAESIGVDSQSESTNNPLHNITTRPIFWNVETSPTNLPSPGISWYGMFKFYDTSNNVIVNKDKNNTNTYYLYKKLALQETDNVAVFYCEMLDQMVFDNGIGLWQNGGGYYEQIPFKYTSDAAECGYYELSIGYFSSPAMGQDLFLPEGTGDTTFTPVYTFSKKRIDKDARERLTFTIRFDRTNVR